MRSVYLSVWSVRRSVRYKWLLNGTFQTDPFKLKTGGLIDLRSIKDRNRDRTYEDVDRDVTNLGSTFSVETNRRDEDSEMYVTRTPCAVFDRCVSYFQRDSFLVFS